jgi:hypothetical protein
MGIRARFFAARTNLGSAKILAARNAPGEAEKAPERLANAHTAANGYANVERRAVQALQDLRLTASRSVQGVSQNRRHGPPKH